MYNTVMFIENNKSGFVTFLEYGIYSFFTIFPFFIFKSFLYQGSSSRFLLLTLVTAIFAISFAFYLFGQKNRLSFLKSPILLAFGIYIAYLFVSAILGVDFATSFWSRAERTSGLFYITHLAVFTLFLVHIVSQKESREKLLKVVLVTSAIYSFCSLLGPQGFDVIFKTNPYDGFMFGNSSFAAMYLLGAFLLSIYYLFSKTKKEIEWYEYLLPFLIVLNPFLLNTRGVYTGISSILGGAKASSIALFVSIAILSVIFLISKIKSVKTRNIVGISFFVVSLLAISFTMYSLLSDNGIIRKAYEKQSTLARPLVWDVTKLSIQEKPLTGWGGDNFTVAYQENFDIRLLTEQYGNEPWFDRAHNIVLDQTLDTGYIGIILYFSLYLILFITLMYVLLKTRNRDSAILASVLVTYFFIHLLELQTAFDTTISYAMLALMVALSVYVYNNTRNESNSSSSLIPISTTGKYVLVSIFSIYFGWSLFFGVFPYWGVQELNGEIRSAGSPEKRLSLYEGVFNTNVDPQGILWRMSTDFQKGISRNSSVLEDEKKKSFLLEELKIITKNYESFLIDNPGNLRAHLNVSDLYIYHMLFGVDKLNEADIILDQALSINNDHPQPYWMKAVISLYRRDFAKAREYVEKAKSMNSEVVETKRLEKYIESSIQTFPEIELYFFNQI